MCKMPEMYKLRSTTVLKSHFLQFDTKWVKGLDHIEVLYAIYGIRYMLYDSVSATDQISLFPRYITWMSSVAESKSYSV